MAFIGSPAFCRATWAAYRPYLQTLVISAMEVSPEIT